MNSTAASIGCGGPANTYWGDGYGTINYVNNGNFNWKNDGSNCSCNNEAYCTPSLYYNENNDNYYSIWSCTGYSGGFAGGGFGLNYSPETMWLSGTRWYCDIEEALPGYNVYGFYKGFIQTSIMSEIGDSIHYKYMLFELNAPLDQGLDFTFQMKLKSRNGTNHIATDQIGFALVQDLPAVSYSYGAFLGNIITPDYVTPVGNQMIDASLSVDFHVTGAGQRYLLIGMFEEADSLNLSGPMEDNFVCRYLMDNVKLFRTDCNMPHVHFNTQNPENCPGSEVSIHAYGGFEPYTWTIDGIVQAETTNDLTFIQSSADHVITVSVDTGACANTDTLIAYAYSLVPIWATDTMLACDLSLSFPSEYTQQHFQNNSWEFSVFGLDNPYIHTYTASGIPDFSFTLNEPGTYEYTIFAQGDDCAFTDTISVSPATPLLTDEEGDPLLYLATEAEHCVNMYDGSIHFIEDLYPGDLHYSWTGTLSDEQTNIADSLTAGTYLVYALDADGRCNAYSPEVMQFYDACSSISGTVTFDVNKNCTVDSSDVPFVNQKVIAVPIGNFAYTDSSGNYTILVPPGTYSMERDYPTPHFNTICYYDDIIQIGTPGLSIVDVNFSDTVFVHHNDIELVTFHVYPSLLVGMQSSLAVSIANYGDTLATGSIAIIAGNSALLSIQTDNFNIPHDWNGDTLIVYFENIEPTDYFYFTVPLQVVLNTDNIGEVCIISGNVILNNLADTDSVEIINTIYGAYDPNIKVAVPAGIGENHFIEQDTQQVEYTIHFQNTGNYPASTVRIVDELSQDLVPSSFELVSFSHYVEVHFYDGELEFLFPAIMLPDSTSDEPNSHGFVTFLIDFVPTLTHGSVIENTAEIYFDYNPAIITNTAFHTVYDCDTFNADFEYVLMPGCDSSEIAVQTPGHWSDTEAWFYNSIAIGNDFMIPNETGWLLHEISNALCDTRLDSILIVSATPGIILATDDSEVTFENAGSFVSFTWYINDVAMPGLTGTSIQPEEGDEVMLLAIDSMGCEQISETVIFQIIGLDEMEASNLKVWPNPASGNVFVTGLPAENIMIDIYDIHGKKLRTINNGAQNTIQFNCSDLSSGIYHLKIGFANESKVVQLMIVAD